MIGDALIYLLEAIASIYLGIIVFFRNKNAKLNRIFFVMTIFMAYNAIIEFGFNIAESPENSLFWLQIWVFWPISYALNFHFNLVFTGHDNLFAKKRSYFILYGFALLSVILNIAINPIEGPSPGSPPIPGDMSSMPSPLFSGFFLSLIWTIILGIIGVIICARYYRKCENRIQKKQSLFIFLAMAIVVGLSFIPNQFSNLSYFIWFVLVAYAMAKFDLFALTPTAAIQSIVNTMTESFILVDVEGKIRGINRASQQMLGFEEGDIIGNDVTQFFKEMSVDHDKSFNESNQFETFQNVEIQVKSKLGQTLPIYISKSQTKKES